MVTMCKFRNRTFKYVMMQPISYTVSILTKLELITHGTSIINLKLTTLENGVPPRKRIQSMFHFKLPKHRIYKNPMHDLENQHYKTLRKGPPPFWKWLIWVSSGQFDVIYLRKWINRYQNMCLESLDPMYNQR